MIEDLRDKKYLTEVELLKMALHSEKMNNFEKDNTIATLKLQLIEAQKALINYKVLEDRKQQEKLVNEHMELLKKISIDNDIPDNKWNYNKVTGEIINNEDV